MIYITGDIHREQDIHKINPREFTVGNSLTENDYVIICGDFGCVWDTIVPIRVLQGPVVDFLTNDTVIFEPITLETPYSEDYSYIWYPSFDTVKPSFTN